MPSANVTRAFVTLRQGRKTTLGEWWGGPLVRSRRPRRPAGALHDADIVGPAAGRGVLAQRAPRPGGPPHHLPSQRGRAVFHGISRAGDPSLSNRYRSGNRPRGT